MAGAETVRGTQVPGVAGKTGGLHLGRRRSLCVRRCACAWRLRLEGSEGSERASQSPRQPSDPAVGHSAMCLSQGGRGTGSRASPALLEVGIRGALRWYVQTRTPPCDRGAWVSPRGLGDLASCCWSLGCLIPGASACCGPGGMGGADGRKVTASAPSLTPSFEFLEPSLWSSVGGVGVCAHVRQWPHVGRAGGRALPNSPFPPFLHRRPEGRPGA